MVLIATALTLVAAHFEWNESLYAPARQVEHFQLDELPIGMLVLLPGLFWLTWRRQQRARHEIDLCSVAEARLQAALAENRALVKETLRILEADRKHMARELHDHWE